MPGLLTQFAFQAYYTIDSRRLASMHHKKSSRNSKLLYGVKQFNLDPKKGLSVLQESGFLPSPATVEKVRFSLHFNLVFVTP